MLAPRTSGAFLCLRCELTQARPRLVALSRSAPRTSFSTSTRRSDAFDDEPEGEFASVYRIRPRRVSEFPALDTRVRRSKGGYIRKTTARLEGAKTLGEDASIIVLEELHRAKKQESVPQPDTKQSEEIPLKLAEALAQERPATLEEVVEQLDKLRDKATDDDADVDEGHYVKQAVYFRLSNHLYKSFTGRQLSHYYSLRKGVEKAKVPQEVRNHLKQNLSTGVAKRPSVRSEWTPGVTQIDRRLPSLDVHSQKKRKNIAKHLLVDQILRDVWKLIMLEELEATGEIELALKDWQLDMLTSGDVSALDTIGRNRKARLEVNTADKVLRITADKHTAEYAANDVELLLQTSETQRFHFPTWLPHMEKINGIEPTTDDVFPDDVLATVSALTGAQLQRSPDKIIIRALDKDTTAEATRCLIKILPLKSDSSKTIDTTGRDALGSSDQFRPVVVEKESVVYSARKTKFGRWSLPVQQNAKAHAAPSNLTKRLKRAQEQVLKMFTTRPEQVGPEKPYARWAHKAEVRLRASFGHTLFPLEKPNSEEAFFLPALPGLSSLFTDEGFSTSFTTRPVLCYEFIAQPGTFNYTSDLSPFKFPKLTAYFRVIDGQQGLSKIMLSFGSGDHQVVLPEEAVDIQFEYNQSLRMTKAHTDIHTRDLREHVLANLRSGGRITAPDLTIPIPKWTVEGMEFDGPDDLIKTKFQFVGVTFTQNVWGDHNGNITTYSTKQSGKLGAKNGKFSTVFGVSRAAKPIAIDDPPNEIRDFVARAFSMAGTITEAATSSQQGPKKVAFKPKQRQPVGAQQDRNALDDISTPAEQKTPAMPEDQPVPVEHKETFAPRIRGQPSEEEMNRAFGSVA